MARILYTSKITILSLVLATVVISALAVQPILRSENDHREKTVLEPAAALVHVGVEAGEVSLKEALKRVLREQSDTYDDRRNTIFGWAGSGQVEYTNERSVPVPEGDLANDPNHNPKLDHQGHIIPQNQLSVVVQELWRVLRDSTERNKDPYKTAAETYFSQYWSQAAERLNIRVEKKKGGIELWPATATMQIALNSLIVWNPANICRAPRDRFRFNRPGPDPDREVIKSLKRTRGTQIQAERLERAAYAVYNLARAREAEGNRDLQRSIVALRTQAKNVVHELKAIASVADRTDLRVQSLKAFHTALAQRESAQQYLDAVNAQLRGDIVDGVKAAIKKLEEATTTEKVKAAVQAAIAAVHEAETLLQPPKVYLLQFFSEWTALLQQWNQDARQGWYQFPWKWHAFGPDGARTQFAKPANL